MKKEKEYQPIRIPSFDGSFIYRAMNRIDGKSGLTLKNKLGQIDLDKFNGVLDTSLDTEQIGRVYSAHQECSGRFIFNGHYSKAIVNVSFDYTVKRFNKIDNQLYVKEGYFVDRNDLTDHVLLINQDGEKTLIAIEVNDGGDYCPVDTPISDELLGNSFAYDPKSKSYHVKLKGRSLATKENKFGIRLWLYQNGFDIDGIHYVRYKRSAGSSREGHCLFIAEPLYDDMMKWSSCGLNQDSVNDQASWQAYISLTLSGIEKTIHIPKQSILLIKDQVSSFSDKVVRVTESGNVLDAKYEEAVIENTIWDGEALLDVSVFEENGYSDKGMMLLRNRFFKTCAFNTNLQKWFEDNGITKLSQLNGFHSKLTRTIKDIKLVITESSLKYLKFRPENESLKAWFEKWIDNVFVDKEQSKFGVVKTDKPTGQMDNRMVLTSYQLLNTLELSRNETEIFLKSSLDYLHNIQKDPMYLRFYSKLWVKEEYKEDAEDISSENYRYRLITEIMRMTDNFEGTTFYRDYRNQLCKYYKEQLKHGRILVNGGNHTLFGNGLEFLHAVIDKKYSADKPLALVDGEIYTQRFPNGKTLLCARSPHITMGNIFVATNKYVPELEKYFNLGTANNIVCVNAIQSNLQQRLNGCDYDSDSMLITDNGILCKAASDNFERFMVPVCDIKSGSRIQYSTSPDQISKLDVLISENRIGEIVNLSQFLNSLFWDMYHNGASKEELDDIYLDICKLAVLSGMEIDKAKRLYNVSADSVISKLRVRKDEYKLTHDQKIPEFFAFMTKGEMDKTSPDLKLKTAMSFIYDVVKEDSRKAPNKKIIPYTDLFNIECNVCDSTGKYSKRLSRILEYVKDSQEEIKELNYIFKNKDRSERIIAKEKADIIFVSCKDIIEKNADDIIIYLLLKKLDKRDVSSYRSLLFATMCYANNGYLMSKLSKPKKEMFDLISIEPIWKNFKPDDVIILFDYHFVKGRK
ncbi:MAG: hypothetical protein K6F14_02570 [Clostridiales bacterium]|nr:hypothetical protein [Clostridiales bacterium]